MKYKTEDMVKIVSNRTKIPTYVVRPVISELLDEIVFQVSQGNTVGFSGFGQFAQQHRAARTGRNPHINEVVHIPARVAPVFKISDTFKRRATKEENE